MFSPTSATIESSVSTLNGSTFCNATSFAKAVSTACLALAAEKVSMPTQIECSEELCVMRMTFIFSLLRASNKRFEKPGMPIIPLPSRLMSAILLILEMPLTILPFLDEADSIIVPSSAGANVFLIQTGIPLLITG